MRSFILALLILISPAAYAQDVPLTFDLASDHIDITTAFNGERLVVFGIRRGAGNVVITVEGPRSDMRVRRKGRILGAWVNKSSMTFEDLPIFYDYAILEGVADHHNAENLNFKTDDDEEPDDVETFKKSLIRNKRSVGLYPEGPQFIKLYEKGDLFKAEFHMPPNVPVGEYTVSAYYEENNTATAVKHNFRVAQVGTNANIFGYAHNYSFFYGATCVLLALFAGWFSNRVRKRA